MKPYKNFTLEQYLDAVAAKSAVPGGGSVAALTAALGTALIAMVANYSLGRGSPRKVEGRLKKILATSEKLRRRLLQLVDSDARAYLQVVATRQAAPAKKKTALRQARQVPGEVCRCCYAAIQLTTFLVTNGNKYLMSDVEVAGELLLSAFKSAAVNIAVNQ